MNDYGIRVNGEDGKEAFSSEYPMFMLDSQHEQSFKTISMTFLSNPSTGLTLLHEYDTGYDASSRYTNPSLYFVTLYVDTPPPSANTFQQYTADGSLLFIGSGVGQAAQIIVQSNALGKMRIWINRTSTFNMVGARITATIYISVEEMEFYF